MEGLGRVGSAAGGSGSAGELMSIVFCRFCMGCRRRTRIFSSVTLGKHGGSDVSSVRMALLKSQHEWKIWLKRRVPRVFQTGNIFEGPELFVGSETKEGTIFSKR